MPVTTHRAPNGSMARRTASAAGCPPTATIRSAKFIIKDGHAESSSAANAASAHRSSDTRASSRSPVKARSRAAITWARTSSTTSVTQTLRRLSPARSGSARSMAIMPCCKRASRTAFVPRTSETSASS